MNATTLAARLLTERPRPRGIARWRHAHWLAVGTVCLGAFLGQLTASVTALVFPALGHHFRADFAAVEWVALAYLLVLVALLAPVGWLSDLVGRKTMYLGGFAVFALASLGAGLAGSLGVLVACRAVQAVGGAMMQANSVALVARGVPGHAMRRALGIQAAAQGLGLALGPSLGGLLVAHASWRWVFWINVPIGVLGILAGWFLLPRTRPEGEPAQPGVRLGAWPGTRSGTRSGARPGAPAGPGAVPAKEEDDGRFDLPGLLLLTGATSALLLALSTASGLPLPGWAVAVLLLASVVLALGLVRQERRASRPLLAPGLVNTPGVRPGLVVALIGYLLLFCPLVLGPVLLTGAGVPVAGAGLVITLLPAAFALAATVGGGLLPRGWSDVTRCRAGAAVAGAGLLLFAVVPAGGASSAGPLLIAGCGLGLLLPANNALVMRAIPAECSAVGGGMVNMARSLGTALGTALPVLGVHLAGAAAGGRTVLLGLAAVAALAVALVRPAARPRGLRTPGSPQDS
ncbi:MFS transporter [Streptomyces sp. CB01881]|uniref:MFS transporter n=1 Tax=Streptomyces sp. CB01881 TaxID=2078691 RepID=UPI000CDCA98E|nr:MFS transporter [Streptomyces sp. CB01881]AUY52276.1 MFS transporter [Streptomyces sp. CB01881]TYC71698.1 MFS transporter [Streptomyces sp. CB01881]